MDEKSYQITTKFFDQRERTGHGVNVMAVIAIAGYSQVISQLGPNARPLFTTSFHERIREFCRPSDIFIEWEESRAIVLLKDIAKTTQLELAGQKLQRAFEAPISVLDADFDTEVRAAFVVPAKSITTPEELLDQADVALRETSTEQPCVIAKLGANKDKRSNAPTSTDIKSGLEAGEFELWGVPWIHTNFGSVISVDVALYWNSERHGRLPPSQYLPSLIQDRAVKDLYWATLRQGAAYLSNSANLDQLTLSIPTGMIQDAEFLPTIEDTWSFYDLDLASLNIRLLDSPSPKHIDGLRAAGIKISLDDFGGKQGLPLYKIQDTPADYLILASELLFHIGASDQAKSLLNHVLEIAQAFDLQVRVTGVAEREMADYLKTLNIQALSGPAYGHWRPAREITP